MKLCADCPGPCTKALRLAPPRPELASIARAVGAITDLLTQQGIICVDFADMRAGLHDGGHAIFAVGEASGPGRAVKAADRAIASLREQLAALRDERGLQELPAEVHTAAAATQRRTP